MTDAAASDDLQARVNKFHALDLPGQPMVMHMGTANLVNDLWSEIKRLRTESAYVATTSDRAKLIEELRFCYADMRLPTWGQINSAAQRNAVLVQRTQDQDRRIEALETEARKLRAERDGIRSALLAAARMGATLADQVERVEGKNANAND